MRFVELTKEEDNDKILVNFDHVFYFGEHNLITKICTNNAEVKVIESVEEIKKKLHSIDNLF